MSQMVVHKLISCRVISKILKKKQRMSLTQELSEYNELLNCFSDIFLMLSEMSVFILRAYYTFLLNLTLNKWKTEITRSHTTSLS